MLKGISMDPEEQAQRGAGLVVWALFILRLMYLLPFTARFDLAGDECYYWDWGRRLDWGYYSKPPMIGWLMGLVGRLTSNSAFGVRLAPLVLGVFSLWLLYRLTARLFNARAGLVAVALAAFSPANLALNLFFTIDAPLVLCWTGALIAGWMCLERPKAFAPWFWLTLAVGLGSLSKQMMLVFPLLFIAFAALTPERRAVLRNPRLWISVVVSLLFLTPVLYWNWRNGWVTLLHTGSHFETSGSPTLLDRLLTFLSFPASQLGMFTPLTWILLMAVIFGGLWKWRQAPDKERYLVIFSAPALIVFFLLALRQSVHPNWPAVFYISAFALTAGWLEGQAWPELTKPWLLRWKKPALWVGAVMMLATYAAPFAIQPLGWAGTKDDLTARLRGWRTAGEAAGHMLEQVPRPDHTIVFAVGHRENASEMAFYMPQHPFVYRWFQDGKVESQYEIWPSPDDDDRKHWDGLVLVAQEQEDPTLLHQMDRWFKTTEKRGTILVPLGNGAVRFYRVYLVQDMQYWPHEKQPSGPDKASTSDKAEPAAATNGPAVKAGPEEAKPAPTEGKPAPGAAADPKSNPAPAPEPPAAPAPAPAPKP